MSQPQPLDLAHQLALLEEKNRDLVARIRELSLENRHQSALIQTLLENTPFGVVLINSQQQVFQINKAAESILALDRVRIIGHSCQELFDCYARHNGCPVVMQDKILDRVETACLCPGRECDTETLLRSVTCSESAEGKILIEAFVDISDIKRAQEGIEIANQYRDNFLAKISHELRTPLNSILGFTEIISDDLDSGSLENTQQYLAHVKTAGQDLLHMVDAILDYTRISANQLCLDPVDFDLPALLRQIMAEIQPACDKNGNQITFDCAADIITIHSDPFRLSQMLKQMLGNACKFTRQGEVKLRVEKKHHAGRQGVCFSIEDTGQGMNEEQLGRVFHEFEQADNTATRSHGGAGLGLTLSQKMARLMGGDITATSQLGVGSIFVLWLPA